MINQTNCSEYTTHIVLNKEERKIAIKMAKRLMVGEDLDFFLNDNSSPLNVKSDERSAFTNTEYIGPYTAIKTAILLKRGNGKINRKDIVKLI